MKNMKKTLAAVLVLVAVSTGAKAQNGANASATAHAQIVTPIAIEWVDDLHFGTLAVNATAGEVAIDPVSPTARTYNGGVSISTANPGTIKAAQFKVTGTGNYSYEITSLTDTITIDNEAWVAANPLVGIDDNMLVTRISAWIPANGGSASTGTLDGADGDDYIFVGGVLEVKGNQEPGVYTTSTTNPDLIEIAVNYN